MRRPLVLLIALLLAVFAAPAFAQDDPSDPGSGTDTTQTDPGDDTTNDQDTTDQSDGTVDDGNDVVPDDTTDYTDGCNYTSGDGDYTYCGCRFDAGTDGDYYYCPEAEGGGGEPRTKHPTAHRLPVAVQTFEATSLPMTGYDPWPVALAGLGLLLTGLGIKSLAKNSPRPGEARGRGA